MILKLRVFFLSYINSSLFFKLEIYLFIIGKEGNKENIRKTVYTQNKFVKTYQQEESN